MAKKKHPFDVVAEKLEVLAAKPFTAQDAASDYWELHAPVNDYPQAALEKPNVVFKWGEGEGLGQDGFPKIRIPDMKLKGRGRWTDVLSAGLPASWSVGYLYNDKALAVVKQFELGNFREHPVTVRDRKGVARTLTYLLVRNLLPRSIIDFKKSEFYIVDMVGMPQAPVDVSSTDDLTEKQNRANEGQLNGCERFSRVQYKKLFFRRGHLPKVDLFRLECLGIVVYISARLKDAIDKAGITGFEIRPNKRLFAGR